MGLAESVYGNIDGPDEHLMYTNIIIGVILKRLYEVTPFIPWYGSDLFTGTVSGSLVTAEIPD